MIRVKLASPYPDYRPWNAFRPMRLPLLVYNCLSCDLLNQSEKGEDSPSPELCTGSRIFRITENRDGITELILENGINQHD